MIPVLIVLILFAWAVKDSPKSEEELDQEFEDSFIIR